MQNSAFGRIHTLLKVKLVKTAEAEDAMTAEDSSCMMYRTVVLHKLFNPWQMTNRTVCADSYFTSVQATESLISFWFRFVSVVKTANKWIPMQALAGKELEQRGDSFGLIYLDYDKLPTFLHFIRIDCNRRYFITSCSSLAPGKPY